MILSLFDIIIVALLSSALVWSISAIEARKRPKGSLVRPQRFDPKSKISFLIDDGTIVDCSPEARQLVSSADKESPDISDIIRAFSATFPTIKSELESAHDEVLEIPATNQLDLWLKITPTGSRLNLTICSSSASLSDQITQIQARSESSQIATLREVTEKCPNLSWRRNACGQVVWANASYLNAIGPQQDESDQALQFPLPALFTEADLNANAGTDKKRNVARLQSLSGKRWYDVASIKTDNGTLHFASDAEAIVQAELAQRNFVQTLSQTFAQLSIGLAIFDRRRQLSTFNPALLDMTNLPFEFLSGRPSIDTMLDRMRELQMLPEPKNYSSWREQFTMMEAAAKDGTYCESWNLLDGQTFRVTGKPHPDGAFALLFEDISAEISLTRRFRSEIETCQSVLDNLDEAIVVFSSAGNLVLANDAYSALWDTDLTKDVVQHDLRVELLKWQDRCTPTRIWTNLKELTNQIGLRLHWSETAVMDDGRQITCSAKPISGGMTMIKFVVGTPREPKIDRVKAAIPTKAALTR